MVVAFVARLVLLRTAAPAQVADWFVEQAERHGIPVQLGDVSAPGAGRLHVARVVIGPASAAPNAPRVVVEDVDIAYDLVAWREPPLRPREVSIGDLAIVTPAPPLTEGPPLDPNVQRLLRELPARLGAIFPGLHVTVKSGGLNVVDVEGKPQIALRGEYWVLTVGAAGDAIRASGQAWARDAPAERGSATLVWRAGAPVTLQMQGRVPHAGIAWARVAGLWPDLKSLPLEWRGGRVEWRSTLTAIGQADWQGEGTLTFADADVSVGPSPFTGWAGTCQWRAHGDPDGLGTRLESLSVESNHGDLTATGSFGRSDGQPGFALALQLYGLTGEQLLPWAGPALAPVGGVLTDLSPIDVTASTLELQLHGQGEALRVRGNANMGTGRLRARLALNLPNLDLLELDAQHATFDYDVQTGTVTGELKVVDGRIEFSAFGLTGTALHGTLGFAPGRLHLRDVRATLPGADATLNGRIPLRNDVEADLTLEAHIADVAALLRTVPLPEDLVVEGDAVLNAHLTGTRGALVSTVSVEASDTGFTLGRLLAKRPGEAMRFHADLRPQPDGVRFDDVVLTLAEGELRGTVSLTGTGPQLRREIRLAAEQLPLPQLRRLSPLARVIGGYGRGTVDVHYLRDAQQRRVYVQLDASQVRCEFPNSPFAFGLADTTWRITAQPDLALVRIALTGREVDILDRLAPSSATGERARASVAVEGAPALGPWETVVDFDFARARWRQYVGESLTGRLTHYRGDYRIEPLRVQLFDGLVTSAVTVDPARRVDAFLRWSECDVDAVLTDVYQTPNAAAGRAFGHASLYGEMGAWPDWQGTGFLRLALPRVETAYFNAARRPFPWRTLTADSASVEFTFNNGTFVVPELLVDKTGIHIGGKGNIDLEGDLYFSCEARVDNELVDQLPLLVRARFAQPDTPETRKVEFTLRDNVRKLRPKVRTTGVGFLMSEIGRETINWSGDLFFGLLGAQ